MSELPSWAGTLAASLGGTGALAQAARVIYRDWRADRDRREAAEAAEVAVHLARIRELEGQLAAATQAHRDTTERLMRDSLGRDTDAVAALLAVRDLPALVRALPEELRDMIREELERPSAQPRRGGR